MKSTVCKVYVEKSKVETMTINSFIFYVNYCTVGNIKEFPVLTNASSNIEDGDIIEMKDWFLSRFKDTNKSPSSLCIICERFNVDENATVSDLPNNFVFNMRCKLIVTDNSKLRRVSIRRKSFIRCSIRIDDIQYIKKNNFFYVLAVGFYSVARSISKLRGVYDIEASLCLRRRLYSGGYELGINRYKIL